MNRRSWYERSIHWLTVALLSGSILATPVKTQTLNATHGQLNYLLGVPTFEASTGWIGGKVAGFGVYVKVGGGIGGTLEEISMDGRGVLTHVSDTTWTLSLQGTSGSAKTFVGLTAGAQYKLVVPDVDTYTGDIYTWGLAFSDNKTFTPYLFNSSVTLTSILPDLPAVYRSFYVPGTKKKLSIDAGITLGTSLENKISGEYISTSAGDLTPEAPATTVTVSSTPYVVSNISEHLKSNVTIYLTPKATVGFSFWFVSYSLTIPIVRVPANLPEMKYQTSTADMSFAMPAAQLSVLKTGTGNGSIQVNGVAKSLPFGPQTYSYGSRVILNAVPSNGSAFTGWTGISLPASQSQNPVTLAIGTNTSLNSDFKPVTSATDSLVISLQYAARYVGGSVRVNGISYGVDNSNRVGFRFKLGEKVRLEYLNFDEFYLTKWSWTDPTGYTVFSTTDNPLIWTADSAKDLNYTLPRYTRLTAEIGVRTAKFSFSVSGTGSGSVAYIIGNLVYSQNAPSEKSFVYGTTMTLQAVPAAGSVFTGWGGDFSGFGTKNPLNIKTGSLDRNIVMGFYRDVRYNVWFQVNMGPYMRLRLFNPETDSIVVRGDFQHFLGTTDWVGNSHLLKKSVSNDSLYYLQVPFPDTTSGNTINYLYHLLRKGDVFSEASVGVRTYTVTTSSSQTIPTVYFDNQKSSRVRKITYRADMRNLVNQGYDPESNLIGIAGNVTPLSWYRIVGMLQDSLNPNLYTVSMSIAGEPGAPVEWKFRAYPESLFVNTGWEEGSNRMMPLPDADTTLGIIVPVIHLMNPTNTTGVREVTTGQQPSGFMLEQNFPNPFNPTTAISYSIPIGAYVSLKIFDTRGEQVAELVAGYQHAGTYAASFDASRLPSGVYLYRLQAGRSTQTKKMVLVK